MRKDLLRTVLEDERRGEKEHEDWLRTHEAASGGSFFKGKRSMRELLSEEERGWVTNGDVGNDIGRDRLTLSPRPWETGPDSLRLPRYMMVMRASMLKGEGGPTIEMPPERDGLNLADLVMRMTIRTTMMKWESSSLWTRALLLDPRS
ncbi:hypothetical protein ACHAW5_011244 [Stephanodiscus triporus]|uniref:Uncharacterized protein n=1 Tax=Stephanodiscus triporus TaxID=2934178 RepID=A0ABD3PQ71_9STRA